MDQEFFRKHLAQTTPFPMGIKIEKAEGIYLYDTEGKRYSDLISGISVSNLGHGNPIIKETIKKQVDQYLHVMVYGEYLQAIQQEFAERLLSFLPAPLNAIYPVNSGTEANEAALKLAKRVTGKTKIVAMKGAYHGATHGSLSVSFNEQKKFAFRPLLPDVYFARFNEVEDLALVDERTACVIVETIQGDAGVRLPDTSYLKALRDKCNQTDTLLIFDEIQVGMGRTGKVFAFEHFGVIPDILTLGKALGGGVPIGAMIASHEHMNQFTHDPMLGHITTFGGNPLAMAGAVGFLKVLEQQPELITSAEEKGRHIEERLRHSAIKEIRRKGLLFAVEFESAEHVQKVVQKALEEGLLTFWFLSCPESFRLAPPLTITHEEIDEAMDTLQNVMNDVL